MRGGPGQGGPLHRGALRPGHRVHQERHRGAQPGGPDLGPGQPRRRRRRRCSPRWSTTPTSSPGSCWPRRPGVELRWLGVDAEGRLDLTDLDRLLDGVKLLTVTAMSNVLGTLTPVRRLADAAHAAGALVLVDGGPVRRPTCPPTWPSWAPTSSASPATRCCGPTGIGVLWGREELLEAMPAFLGGGEMIRDVRLDGWTPNEIPWKFEAGTPPIAEIIGLGAAVDYLEGLGMDAVREHEVTLTAYALRTLTERFGDELTIHGPAEPGERGGVLSFAVRGPPPPRRVPGPRPARGVRAGRPPLRQAADATPRRRRPPPGPRSTSTTTPTTSTRLADALAARRRASSPCSVRSRPMPGLEDLYREIILDHYRNPRNRGELESPPAHRVEGFNPLCGDEIVVYLDVDDDGDVARHPHRRPGLLDQPVVGLDDVAPPSRARPSPRSGT